MHTTLLLLLPLVSAALAYCQSTYSAAGWHGWTTTDGICFGFVIDSHYACSAYPQLTLPAADTNTTYLHLGSYPIGPGGRCSGFLGETGACLNSQDTSLGVSSSTRQVFAESPELNFSAASDCTLQLELAQSQDRDFFTLNAQNYYKYDVDGAEDNLPERAAAWTAFSTAYDGRSRIRLSYRNAYSFYTRDATLLAIRSLSVQCRGNITGPNVSTVCFADPTPTPAALSASPAVSATTMMSSGQALHETHSPSSSGHHSADESVSSAGSAIDCSWPLFFCCFIWLVVVMQYKDFNSNLIAGVWLAFLVLFFSKFINWLRNPRGY